MYCTYMLALVFFFPGSHVTSGQGCIAIFPRKSHDIEGNTLNTPSAVPLKLWLPMVQSTIVMHFAAVQLTWACSLGKICLNSCLASLHSVLACVFNTIQLLRRHSLILFNERSPPQMLQYSTEQRLGSVRLSPTSKHERFWLSSPYLYAVQGYNRSETNDHGR